MSKIYVLIETQVNNLLRLMMEDDYTGQIQYGPLIKGPKWVQPIVSLITTLVFLGIALTFGIYLWNYGIQPVFPGIVAKIDGANPAQASSVYLQLVITLIALMMFF
jgi:hypothetical protein